MAVKVPYAHMPQLLSWLAQHLPHSFKLHGELKSRLAHQFPDLEFFVDRWPDPQAVVARGDPNGQQQSCRDFLQNVVLGVYGVNEEALSQLTKDPTAVDWNTKTVFSAFSDKLVPVLRRIADEMGRTAEAHPNFLLKATPQDLKPIPVPEGLKLQPLADADIKMINSTWKFASEGSDVYIKEFIQRFPSICLVMEDGQYVGHMMGTSYGTMGMLHVNPEFRRKGYAKVIVSQLAQKYFDRGEDAYVIIEEDNLLSLKLHQSLGFRQIPEFMCTWMTCSPKGCCQKSAATCCV